jgi:hypothetical protein
MPFLWKIRLFRRQPRGRNLYRMMGIAFEDNKKVRIKGSEVGYSWRTIETILERQKRQELKQSQEYRQTKSQKNDILEEQKTGNQLTRELIENVKLLTARVEGFDEKLTHQKVITLPADTKPLKKNCNWRNG